MPSQQQHLLAAIDANDATAARAALDAGADPNEAGEFDRTPLHAAARRSADIIELLIERGARLNSVDGDGRTALHLANADAARVLLAHDADVLALDKNGNSALHTAAEESALVCALLVDAGVPVDVRNNAGLSPLHFAVLKGNHDVVQYLRSRGADMNATMLVPLEATEEADKRPSPLVWLLASLGALLVLFTWLSN